MRKNTNGLEDERNGDEAEPGRGDVGIGVCGYENWDSDAVLIIFGCSSKADAAKSVVECLGEERLQGAERRRTLWVYHFAT